MTALVERAYSLAMRVHHGQLDRAGLPVTHHLIRVASKVLAQGHGELVTATALLHDSVEDHVLTEAQLRAEMPHEVAEAVLALTRHHFGQETYMEFVARAGANPIARLVKLADLHDNMTRALPSDPEDRKQYEALRRKRYPRAVAYLMGL